MNGRNKNIITDINIAVPSINTECLCPGCDDWRRMKCGHMRTSQCLFLPSDRSINSC